MKTKTFTGFTPTPKQKEIINGILSSDVKHHIICASRQFGKSMLSMNLVLYWAINEPTKTGQRILWAAPSYNQSRKVMEELHAAIVDSGIVESANFSSNTIKLKTGSTIIFRSTERYEFIRGETFTAAILDEFAFMKDGSWKEAIRPTLIVKGRKVVFISTPKGKNEFYNLYQQGLNPDSENYKAYKSTIYETPFIDPQEIEDAKQTLPEAIFKQEYLAEFLDGGGEVFSDLDKNVFHKWEQGQGPYYAACDIARADDYTVMTVMDRSGRIVEIYRKNQVEWNTIIDDMVAIAKKWNATVMVEENGVGSPIFSMVKEKWQNTHPFITTNKSKQEIIEGMILDMNEGAIRIPSRELFPALYHELTIFTFDYNPKTRSISYQHPVGQHDDTVIATAICNYNRKINKSLGTYSYMSRKLG